MNEIRLLRADEIECRISTVNEKGVSLLLYKDARVDQKILDETYGPFNWKRSHMSIDGNLYCTVEVFDPEKNEWIGKQDVGVSGISEKAKSQASDSFKRSCFLWGIGRELYTAPFIWVSSDKVNIVKKGDSFFCYTKFKVDSIEYNDQREIVALTINDQNGQRIYSYRKQGTVVSTTKTQKMTKAQADMLHKEMSRTGVTINDIASRYHISDEEDISQEMLSSLMQALGKTKSKEKAA